MNDLIIRNKLQKQLQMKTKMLLKRRWD